MKKTLLTLVALFASVFSVFNLQTIQAQTVFTDKHILYDDDLPQGTMKELYGSAGFWFNSPLGGITLESYFGKVKKILEGNDGNVYIYEPIYYLANKSWIKAERATGDTLVVHLPQAIDSVHYEAGELYFNSPDSVMYYYADHLVPVKLGGETTYVPSPIKEIKFTYKDGVLKQVENADGSCDLLGAVDPSDKWAGCGDFFIERRPQTDVPVTVPSTAEAVDYVFNQQDYQLYDDQIITCYVNGNDFYFQPDPEHVDGWAKGVIENGKVTFNSQYLGKSKDGQDYLYFIPANVTSEEDDYWGDLAYNYNRLTTDKLEFIISEDGNSFVADSGYVVNVGKEKFEKLNYSYAYNPSFAKVIEVPAVPNNPEIIYAPSFNDRGVGSFVFYEDPSGTNGEQLNTNKLFYNIFIDDETKPFTFTAAACPNDFDEDCTDVPFMHSSPGLFISGNTREIRLYNKDWKEIGVQMIYRGANEEHKSDVVWVKNTTTGINGVVSSRNAGVDYFDLSGLRVVAPKHGVFVERTRKANGQFTYRKVVK